MCISLAVLLFSSCKTETPIDVTGISLDETTWSVGLGDTTSLKATILPTGATGTVSWASSNTAIATVDSKGIITGVKLGTANIIASFGSFTATCALTVTESRNFKPSLSGTEYYPIIMDTITSKALGSKIKADFRPDEMIKFLYVWNSTYIEGASSGPNFYGQIEKWVSLTVGTVGWSGAGFNIKTVGNEAALASLKAITDNPDKYYLHIGIKSKDNTTHAIIMGGQTEVKFAIGSAGFVDGAATYPTLADFTRDGEWHQIEIPMTTIKNMGLTYSNVATDPNIFAFLSGGVTGRTIDLDAVFIYKKQ